MSDSFFLVGHPVSHSVSPAIHGAAYRALGRTAEYGLADCPDEASVRAVVERVRSGEVRGVNVTVPWKKLVFELADERDESATLVGAANVLARSAEGRVVAYNTDAWALARELEAAREELERRDPGANERRALLFLGTGGAALAALVSARWAGYGPLFVSGRKFTPGRSEAEWPEADAFRARGAIPVAWPNEGERFELPDSTGAIVQATSAGMKGAAGGHELAARVPWASLAPIVAYDLVYNPPITPFLELAASHGHVAVGGLGMLVGQAARAIEIWWGETPPRAPLTSAARAALGLDVGGADGG